MTQLAVARVPAVAEFEGIDVDQVPLAEALRVVEDGLNHAPVSAGAPIASVDTIVIMKLLAGRRPFEPARWRMEAPGLRPTTPGG